MRRRHRKEPRILVGLMSGTSVDGISAAVVNMQASSGAPFELLAWETYSYPAEVRKQIFELFSERAGTVDKICSMNFTLGEYFAKAALKSIAKAKLEPKDICAIGSHGQTIYHKPSRPRATLQIGHPAVIAERTGITTVGDFRAADVAAGGQGAPLLPFVDHFIFRSRIWSRAIQNIGGIANVTVLPKRAKQDEIWGFDTGPGNMIVDALVNHFTAGHKRFDKGGEMARRGSIDTSLLRHLMATPFIRKRPPKSTGREMFGTEFVHQLLRYSRSRKLGMYDIIATATAFTCESMAYNYRKFVYPKTGIDEVIIGGGGSKNPVIVETLRKLLQSKVMLHEDFNIPSEAKEAIAFAILADMTLQGKTSNVPAATGAASSVVLGMICPGR